MRASLIAAAAVLNAFTAAAGMEVDGVKVRGRVNAVSLRDIREAITTGIGTGRKASEVVVISSKEMRVYLQPRDLGWIPVVPKMISLPGDPPDYEMVTRVRWWGTVKGIDDADVLGCIRRAEHVYIFPVAKPLHPRRDNQRMRRLDDQAASKIARLLGDDRSWYHGAYNLAIADDGSRGIGLLFRRGKDEAVFFWARFTTQKGTFNGRHMIGLLDDEGGERQMKRWVRRHAQRELPRNET